MGTIIGQKRPPDSGINMAESRAMGADRKSPPVAGGKGTPKVYHLLACSELRVTCIE